MNRALTLKEIAQHVEGRVEGDDQVVVTGVGSLENATSEQVTYLESERHGKRLAGTRAAAVILGTAVDVQSETNIIRVS